MLRLPNLESLSGRVNNIALLFDESENGTCYLGLGSRRSFVIGGDVVALNVIDTFEKFVCKGGVGTRNRDYVGGSEKARSNSRRC